MVTSVEPDISWPAPSLTEEALRYALARGLVANEAPAGSEQRAEHSKAKDTSATGEGSARRYRPVCYVYDPPTVPPTEPPATSPASSTSPGAGAPPLGSAPVDELTGGVNERLAELAGRQLHELPGETVHELLDSLEQASRRIAALRAEALRIADDNGLWALSGARSVAAWLQARTQFSAGKARQQVRHARALDEHLPATRAALLDGEIGAEHAQTMVRWTTQTPKQRAELAHPEVGESFLINEARSFDATTFTRLARHWAAAADPEAADRHWRTDEGREEFTLSKTTGGYHLSGWLNETHGQTLATAVRSHDNHARLAADDRSPGQRRAAALVGLARSSLDAGWLTPNARIRPHLSVTVDYHTLEKLAAATRSARPLGALTTGSDDDDAGWAQAWREGDDHIISASLDHERLTGLTPAVLAGGEPIPATELARLACESQLTRIIFGPQSTILDVGRQTRIFPTNQVRAITARDRNCKFPGCHAPPMHCEVHHSLWWYKHHGKTSTDNGILLCWHHHDHVHANEIDIHRKNGQWHFTTRHGLPMTTPGEPAAPG